MAFRRPKNGFSFIIQIPRRNHWKSSFDGAAAFDRHAERERLQDGCASDVAVEILPIRQSIQHGAVKAPGAHSRANNGGVFVGRPGTAPPGGQ